MMPDRAAKSERKPQSTMLLVSGMVLAFPVAVFLWRRSLHTIFFALSADDFGRTFCAWQVTQGNPLPSDLWPPLQFWIEAVALRLYPTLLSVPYLVNLAASTVALLCLALLAREMGLRGTGLALTVILAATMPWFIWLSVSGLAEPLFILFLALAYLGIVRWYKSAGELGLWMAALGLLAAAMLRFESWGHSAVFSLGVMWRWWHIRGRRPHKWLLAALIPWISPAAWLIFRHGSS